jgi:hypothetical protein
MASGSLYRALARNQFLQPIADTFRAIQDQNRKEQWTKAIQDAFQQAKQGFGDIGNATQEQTVQQENPAYTPFSQPKPNIPNFNPTIPGAGVTFAPSQQNNEMVTRPTFDKQVNVPLSDMGKYDRASNLAEEIQMKLFGDPNSRYDSGQANFLNQMIGREVNRFMPSYEYRNFNPKEGETRTNTRTGERIVTRQPTPEDLTPYQKAQLGISKQRLDEMTPYQKGMLSIANKKEGRESIKPPDVSKEEGLISKYEEQLNNIDFTLNETNKAGNKKNRIYEGNPLAEDEPGAIGLWEVYNPITNKQEYLNDSKVNQLKKEIGARLESAKKQRQSKVDKVYGQTKTATSQTSDVETNIKAYAKKWNISEDEARSYLE